MSRVAVVERKTSETDIRLRLDLDGVGRSAIQTGVGFFDHMLTHLAKHGLFDLDLTATGDLHIDAHHTVEDVGLALGQAYAEALGDKAGIRRYGHCTLPMDETLATVAVDFSGRPVCVWKVETPTAKVGEFDAELAAEFWRAFATAGRLNYHALLHHGGNTHHILEAVFKASARALRAAVELDLRAAGQVPSTKGVL